MPASTFSRRCLRGLPLTASALAIAAVMAQPACAQSSFNAGAPTVNSGTVTPDYSVAGRDVYTVTSPTAVLTFTPTDTGQGGGLNNPINFQNAQTEVVFQNAPGGQNFTVLNRIVPSDPGRPVFFDGTVTSQLRDAGSVATRGGNVWFYSPGGIILGDNAVFDVGSLLLSTADPTGGSGTITSTTNLTLDSTNSPGGVVNVLSGAKINATNPNSYVALVAPIVFHRGTTQVNGAAALVAAETAFLTFDQGLFQISVGVGTGADSQPLQLRGTIALDRSSGAATNNRGIYAVAIPKNDAISMIVAPDGYYGFNVAQGAVTRNGAVYLQAGGDLTVDPAATETRGRIQVLPTIGEANISIEGSSDQAQFATGGRFTAPVAARASGTVDVANITNPSGVVSAVSFASDAAFYGRSAVNFVAAGGTINVGGDLDMQSFGSDPGIALLSADSGGAIAITGRTLVRAASPLGISYNPALYNVSTGGAADIRTNGGTITSAGFVDVDAPGSAAAGQIGQGGTAQILVNGGSLTSPLDISVNATAIGIDRGVSGGTATASVIGGSLQTAGRLAISAGASAPAGANATGGTAQLLLGVGGVVTATTQTQIDAGARGGNGAAGGSGGSGTAGTARMSIASTNGPVTSFTTDDLLVISTGEGGDGGTGASSSGGTALAGTTSIDIGAGSRFTIGTFASVFSSGEGGDSIGGGAAGAAQGGSATFTSQGIVDVGGLSVGILATGGNKTGGTGNAGNAQTGNALLSLTGGSLLATREPGGSLVAGISSSVSASGGSVSNAVGSGGAATTGNAALVTTGTAVLTSARAFVGTSVTGGAGAGAGSSGGAATAGIASITQNSINTLQTTVSMTVRANATAGAGIATGGVANAGTARIRSTAGTLTNDGTTTLSAIGQGGASAATGGAANGGIVSIESATLLTATGAVSMTATGNGGDSTAAGNGGAAGGGQATIATTAAAGDIRLAGTLSAITTATGGTGRGAIGIGGSAVGGTTLVSAPIGAVRIQGDSILNAIGVGGGYSGGGTGRSGNASGGTAAIRANAGTVNSVGRVVFDASAFVRAGDGSAANAQGGLVEVRSFTDTGNNFGGGGAITLTGGLVASIGAQAGEVSNTSGNGGSATGGQFTLLADTGAVTVGEVNAFASANGFAGDNPATNLMRGGTMRIEARNADLTVNGSLSLGAAGQAASLINAQPARTGGASEGGTILIYAAAGRRLNVTGQISASAGATGGSTVAGVGATASRGTGGVVTVEADGTISAGSGIAISADGLGGTTGGFGGARGGDGYAGQATVRVTGRLTTDALLVSAEGTGGNASFSRAGDGGTGYGGIVQVQALGGGTLDAGQIVLAASGRGGSAGTQGGTGGTGYGGGSVLPNSGALLLAADGGTITGTSNVLIRADGSGGTSAGTTTGGDGIGGTAQIQATNGTIDLTAGGLSGSLTALGFGGTAIASFDGNFNTIAGGGAGGVGLGGTAQIIGETTASGAGAVGRVRIGTTDISASGTGGNGADALAGLAGGAGGRGTGGAAQAAAQAGNGVIAGLAGTVLTLDASGIGGVGGTGGVANSAGQSGAGGTGGLGRGGQTLAGTVNGADTPFTAGSATFSTVALDAGGVGGTGGRSVGNGGSGGEAIAGTATLQSIGAPVTADSAFVSATAQAGQGGLDFGDVTGADGNATGGSALVTSIARTDEPARGLLTVTGAIAADAEAVSATGTTIGGFTFLSLVDGDANIGTYFAHNAGTLRTTIGRSQIRAEDGTLTAAFIGTDTIDEYGLFTVGAGRIDAGSVFLQTTSGLLYGDGSSPSYVPRNFTVAQDLTASVGADYVIDATDSVGGSYTVTSAGRIQTQDIRAGGNVLLTAGTTVTTGAIGSTSGVIGLASRTDDITTGALNSRSIVLLSPQNVRTGALTTGVGATGTALISNISLVSSGAAAGMLGQTGTFDPNFDYATLATFVPQRLGGEARIDGPIRTGNFLVAATGGVAAGAIDASTRILIDSGTTIALGNVDTPAALTLQADGVVTTGTLSAQSVTLTSTGANIGTGAITSASAVTASAGGTIGTGNVQAAGFVGLAAGGALTAGTIGTTAGTIALASRTGSVTTSALTASRSVVALAQQGIATGAITSGTGATDTVLLSGIGLVATAPGSAMLGATGPFNAAFDYASLATIAPQRLGGIARINGPTRTGNFLVSAAGGVAAGAIDASTRILIDSGATIALGDIVTPATLTLQAVSGVTAGALSAQSVTLAASAGNVATGAITSTTGITATASGQIGTGNLQASGPVTLRADGALTTGAISSTSDILAVSRTAQATTGNLQAGSNVAVLASTGITTGGISARRTNNGYVLLADAANAGTIDINATGVSMTGPLNVNGPISAGIVRTAVNGPIAFGGAIDAATFARILGGDVSLAGSLIGPDLAISSANLRLGANAGIGDATTQTATFTVTGSASAVLGGTGEGRGYTLDAAELSRIRAANVSFTAAGDSEDGPALTVRDATLAGSSAATGANITAANGTLSLRAGGTISVIGNLRFTDAGTNQSLVINGGAVRIVTDTGSIGMFTGTDLGGRLAITANRIEAGTSQLFASNSASGAFAGPLSSATVSAIGAAAATARPEGYLQANRIELSAVDDIVVQNSGTAALAAGFSAGAGGLFVTNLGGTTAGGGFNVLIYGRIAGASGFLTNNDTLGAVRFGSADDRSATAGYSTQSRVNGCTFVQTNGCTIVTPPPPEEPEEPETPQIAPPPIAAIVRDVIDGNFINFSRDSVQLPSFEQPAAIDLTILESPAFITDPVASAGNPSLWESAAPMQAAPQAGPATGKKQDDDRTRRGARREQRR